ncbi:DNA-binding protein [Gemmobacter lutimaris]|uniref:DNA-binding protein n=1 Tax=Gemmobacter lutimaris TaxID=2306023 RepID=A0A398BMG6_9RHOB|nr:helix-turn-helix domain-containing protein [Gemmobacter lutimaris]RID91612.1 DNA-binding protein [Gemmobacter lutimaris]
MDNPVLFTVDEARAVLRIGRSLFYELVKNGRLPVVKLAGKTLVRRDDLDAFIAGLGSTGKAA